MSLCIFNPSMNLKLCSNSIHVSIIHLIFAASDFTNLCRYGRVL